ncbi:MAG: dockerin type I repeat-containing protein [Candidatus Zixiibacteriota bacterium]|nr:MAG: dockerin type I repeat-containing protein [candidate division Zixibacteria bacterium]
MIGWVKTIGFSAGDVNGDGSVNILDAGVLAKYLYLDGPAPEAGDFDGSGKVDVSDILYLVRYLYRDGPPPAPPERR